MSLKRSSTDFSKCKKFKTNPVERDFVKYISVPSLKCTAITNIVITLWKSSDLGDIALYNPYRNYELLHRFDKAEVEVLEKLNLLLPNVLRAKAANIIRPLGLQILNWIKLNFQDRPCCRRLPLDVCAIDSLCWTAEGTIDRLKTLKTLFYNRKSDVPVRFLYQIACRYCLKDHIFKLWGEMSEDERDIVTRRAYVCDLIKYWTYVINNEISTMIIDSPNKNICKQVLSSCKQFSSAIRYGHVAAAKYFWFELTDTEKSNGIEKWITIVIYNGKQYRERKPDYYQNINKFTDILCFLLSQVEDTEQQQKIFYNHSKGIINALFFDWPWQRFLLPTLRAMWDFLDGNFYVTFISQVVKQIKVHRTTHQMLRELWYDSPINLKKCFLQHVINNTLGGTEVLWKLLEINDIETIKVILNYANVEEKRQIMFSAVNRSIYTDKLALLDVLIRETFSSKCDIDNVKDYVRLQIDRTFCDWVYKDNWETIEKHFNSGFISHDQFDNLKKHKLDIIKIFCSLICLGNYELIHQFMHWYFNTDEEINQFKKEFVNGDDKYRHHCGTLLWRLSCERDGWSLFKKFIKYSFDLNEEVNGFKKTFKKSVLEFLKDENYKFAERFLVWCLSSDEEINQFKKELMFSKEGMNLLLALVNDGKTRTVVNIIKWYSVSKEVVIELKEKVKYLSFTKAFFDPGLPYQNLFYVLHDVIPHISISSTSPSSYAGPYFYTAFPM